MFFNEQVIARAEQMTQEALADLLAQPGARRGIAAVAVAGAGKSYFIGSAVGAARSRNLRVAVCAPTNDQVFGLVRSLASRYPSESVTFIPALEVHLPEDIARLANVVEARPAPTAHGAPIIVGTFDKLGDAASRGDLEVRDVLFADEAFQADSARYYAVAALAPSHLLVGDWGQLQPFSTVNTDRWRGLTEDPLQTAIGVLRRNHPATPVYPLPITRRLDPRAIPLVRAFYPGHAFDAAVLPGVRELTLLPGVAQGHRNCVVDQTLNVAAKYGWAHLELPEAPVLTADPGIVEMIVDLVCRLRDRDPRVRCEFHPGGKPLSPRRIAVGVSHNDQKDLLRLALDAAGCPKVTVSTANKLQGLEFDVVIAWHPLAGLPEADSFHLDPGRCCVLLTRHRHAAIIVGRAGDRTLVAGIPPSTPAFLGWDPDPVLDGWGIHQAIFDGLDPYRIAA